MYYTCMFRMVGVMVCMKKIMAMLMQMGKCSVFGVFALLPMIVGMKIVIMLLVGILIMVMAVAMRSDLAMVVRRGIMVVDPVLFLTVVVAVGIVMCMFIRGMIMVRLFYLLSLALRYE
jgi:hypothetical protein